MNIDKFKDQYEQISDQLEKLKNHIDNLKAQFDYKDQERLKECENNYYPKLVEQNQIFNEL